MRLRHRAGRERRFSDSNPDTRIRVISLCIVIVGFLVVGRLAILMLWQHTFYETLATSSQEITSQLVPKRGDIFVQDSRTKEAFPVALDKDVYLMFADTRSITTDKEASDVANALAPIFNYNDEKKLAVYLQLNKRTDPYEPIEQRIDEDTMEQVKAQQLPGIHFVRKSERLYPEGVLAANTIGFLGKDKDGSDIGRYGVEGYWNAELAGKGGFLEGRKSASGGWIPLAGRLFEPAEDGVDVVLTIDRTIQYKACEILREAAAGYGAVSASLIVMEPFTGAILAMCSVPDFNPNEYGKVENVDAYNNTNIFTAYEVGSVFKPLVMAAAINEGLVNPNSPFHDTGIRTGLCSTPIRNANQKAYNDTDMTGVLENSINIGMVYIAELLGKGRFIEYVEKFGFGTKTGIELDSEVGGDIRSLYTNKGNKIDCYGATASFGQGITATPMQVATAYGAIANGGMLMQPRIIDEIRYKNGKVEKMRPKEVTQVITKKTASLVSGMLVRVVDEGHATAAGVEGYYVGGKTGTAQIAGPGGYSTETNHTFVGIAPIEEPKFVMLIKFEKPQRAFADSTTTPTFHKIAKFILDYYQVAPVR